MVRGWAQAQPARPRGGRGARSGGTGEGAEGRGADGRGAGKRLEGVWERRAKKNDGGFGEELLALDAAVFASEDGFDLKTFEEEVRPEDLEGTKGRDGCLIRYFEANGPFSPNATEIYDKLDYFRNNESRMRYGEFKKAGYVIGSGAVEGSCRSLVNQRADLSGQWWHPKGAVNILRIRGMIIDGLHEQYWRSRGLVNLRLAA